MDMFSSALYRKAPAPLQSSMITMRALSRRFLREGERFNRIQREIENSQYLSDTGLTSWRDNLLEKVLSHAVRHVPFYRDLDLAHLLAVSRPADALSAFPIINKSVVREQSARFMAVNAKRPLFKGSTSGTTGTPLLLRQDLAAINRENAFIWRQLEWAGLKKGERRAWIRGDLIVPSDAVSPPFWRRNHAENMLMFSSYHLTENNAATYVATLERFDPVVIQAYPSSIIFLAKWLEAKGRVFDSASLNGIVTSSESLAADNKSLIERSFGCRVFDWYGQFERVAAIGTCEHGRQHIVSDYSFVELVKVKDGLYEIVGTGFNNFAMPLIRYRTGDYVTLEDTSSQCGCGRHFPLVALIQGRDDDVVKLPDGRHVGRLDHIFKGVDGVLEAQVRQDQNNRIDILVVATSGYSTTVETKLRINARERLGSSVQINVQTVSSIPRSGNGKLRGVVCNV